jgi:23S rRNA C2498 (ribose-2'-O)-methylase RlmM
MKMEDNKKALLLAGKLATAARLVTTANTKNLSQRITQMEEALDEYDNQILSMTNKDTNDGKDIRSLAKETQSIFRNLLEETRDQHNKEKFVNYITSHTGKGGAIAFKELVLGRKLTDLEKASFRDGVYRISPVGLEYLGQWK